MIKLAGGRRFVKMRGMHDFNKMLFGIVLGCHLALILALLAWGAISRWPDKPPSAIPVEFIVDVRPLAIADEPSNAAMPEPEPEPVAPDPRPRIEVSRKRITRTIPDDRPKPAPLSEDEIRRLLAAGARPGDETRIPDADSRALALIKTTLDSLWRQPSKAAAGDDEAVLKLWIETDGRVSRAELVQPSGNPHLDASVETLGAQVAHIPGLSKDFIRRRSPVTVAFRVR